jgi:predicted PurR-regulated permease PerM
MEPDLKQELRTRRLHWPTTPTGMSLVGFSQVGLFVIVLGYVLHQMKSVLLPLVLAVLVSMIVYPVYLTFRKLRLPKLMSATATVCGLVALLFLGTYQAFIPGVEWARTVDEAQVLNRLQEVFRPMKEVQAEISQMADRVEQATSKSAPVEEKAEEAPKKVGEGTVEKFEEVAEDVSAAGAEISVSEGDSAGRRKDMEEAEAEARANEKTIKTAPVMVEIHEDQVSVLFDEMRDFGLGLASFLLLILFILAYGNRIVGKFNKDPVVSGILDRMGSDVSSYLSTITVINAALGVCIGAAMWGLGMPRPVLWGVMAMILNFIPYVGALTGTFVIFMAAVVNFQQPGMVIAVPLVYFALTAIEGNLVTPTVLGERFSINPLVVFVWIFAWAGFWGIAGMLIAMPALVIFKIICENTEKMEKFRRVLAA